jgi:hypothetical protein
MAKAERLASTRLLSLGQPIKVEKLVGRGKWLEENSLLASLIRKRTGVLNAWIAESIEMGGESKGLRWRLVKSEKDL